MKNTWFWGLILLQLFFALATPNMAIANDAPSNDVKQVAEKGMRNFLRSDRLDYLHDHGFENQADLDNAVLGEGFEIFTVSLKNILDDAMPRDLQALITPTNQWNFLILVGDKAKAVMTIGLIDGNWVPLEFGSSMLAQEMQNFFAAWQGSHGGSDYHYKLNFRSN